MRVEKDENMQNNTSSRIRSEVMDHKADPPRLGAAKKIIATVFFIGVVVLLFIRIQNSKFQNLKREFSENIKRVQKRKMSNKKSRQTARITVEKPEMVLVKGGSFMMGSSLSGKHDEKPEHEVKLSGFHIGKYEVTVREFEKFIIDADYVTSVERSGVTWGYRNGKIFLYTGYSWSNPGYVQSPDHPVVCISWYDAVEYCNWLSGKHGLKECYAIDYKRKDMNNLCGYDLKKWTVTLDNSANGYRLPTEAEWEFAARAGEHRMKWAGINRRDEVSEFGNTADKNSVFSHADKSLDDGFEFAAEVGKFKPNGLDLYDMTGNAWEMCWDWFDPGYYNSSSPTNPHGGEKGQKKVIRGGGWDFNASFATTTNRNSMAPNHGSCTVGFRLVRNKVPGT